MCVCVSFVLAVTSAAASRSAQLRIIPTPPNLFLLLSLSLSLGVSLRRPAVHPDARSRRSGAATAMQEYFLFLLFSVTVILFCISCCIGCKVRQRQRLQEGALDGRHNFLEGGTNNAGGATGAPGQPLGPAPGFYQEIYYQQQYPQGFGGYDGGAFQAGAANVNYAGGLPQGNTQQAVPATVLFAAPTGVQIGNVSHPQRLPEALVADVNGAINGTSDGAAAANNRVASRPAAESPYGEADYVLRASATPLQQMSPNGAPPPPQYAAPARQQSRPEPMASSQGGTGILDQGKDLN